MLDAIQARLSEDENAVSELIGTILLISIMTLAVSIVALAIIPILSSDTSLPSVQVTAFNDTDILYIRHMGGDSIHENNLRILIDGIDHDDLDLTTNQIQGWAQSDGDGLWEPGETLSYDFPDLTTPATIIIVYDGDGGSYVLYSVTQDGTGIPPPGVTEATP
ncbi:hypothetical protein ABH15_13205 [Methanoculleus taiwanensis]|uniref:Archaeal Type IV pilin N-terminal domain-containing protein n=1 Tax=Methanoculleus taiwanensis TaxID=1550565 RepID=A0A498GW47_9EURY|nr:type IV pilin N-terminal domain-containing protein [Methanoculleus taiwanensis]RXE55169.1 hypothetical protein ABH15_13205 [Methanoculleus taiwanensis]